MVVVAVVVDVFVVVVVVVVVSIKRAKSRELPGGRGVSGRGFMRRPWGVPQQRLFFDDVLKRF